MGYAYDHRPSYYADPDPPIRRQPSTMHTSRSYWPNSIWTWTFVMIVLIEAVVIIALEAYCFAMFLKAETTFIAGISNNPVLQPYTRAVPVSLSVYIFGMLYELLLVWDALRLKNTIQVIGLCFCNLGLLIYAAVQLKQIDDAVSTLNLGAAVPGIHNLLRPPLTAIPCILALGTLCMGFVAFKLYNEFAWTIYKHISADLRMKRRYLTYQIYIALLKFDFFFFLGFTIQFLVVVVHTDDPEFWVTVAAIPVTVIVLFMAGFWTRREYTLGMVFTIVLYFAALAYFIFKLVRIYDGSPQSRDYVAAAKPLTAFAVLTLLLIVATIINAILCTLNFHKGLKPHLTSSRQGRKSDGSEGPEKDPYANEMPNRAHQPMPTRMTID